MVFAKYHDYLYLDFLKNVSSVHKMKKKSTFLCLKREKYPVTYPEGTCSGVVVFICLSGEFLVSVLYL